MAALRKKKIDSVHRRILSWYRTSHRKFLWRSTRDPHIVLLSEIMLQQTQARRVQEKLPPFLRKFPTMSALARSSKADVIRAWQGMGYNNRAVRLRDLARIVMEKHEGALPSDAVELEKLPGIGRYTASAIECFSHGKNVPVVDINVQRVLSRLFRKVRDSSELMDQQEVWRLASRILPRDAYGWNQALMELGGTICTARMPKCDACPVADCCSSRAVARRVKLRATSRKIHAEPTYAGIPRRIWRGRIVEILRNERDSRPLTIRQVGRRINSTLDSRELPGLRWIAELVRSLERDGLVQTTGHSGSAKVALANG